MKLGSITANNFIGIRTATIMLDAPVTMIAGLNYAGKSSMANAIKLALTGDPTRVTLKKDFGHLVREGAKTGNVKMCADGHEFTFDLPKGKWSENELVHQHLQLVLDINAFSNLSATEKRKVIFSITGMNPTPEAISQRLVELGCESDKVNAIKAMLLIGVDEAHREAKSQASKLRILWEQITKERYGSDKGQDWTAEHPAYQEDALKQCQHQISELEDLLALNQKQYGMISAEIKAEAENRQKREIYGNPEARLKRLQDKLAIDEKDLAEWIKKMEAMKAKAAGAVKPVTFVCPCCSSEVYHHGPAQVLMKWVDDGRVADTAAAASAIEYEGYVNRLKSTVANDKRDISECEKAIAIVSSLPALKGEVLNLNLSAVKAKIDSIKADLAKEKDTLADLENKARACAEAATKTSTAATHHADIQAWSKVAEHLAPDGIVSEFLVKALRTVNDRLRQSSMDSGWPQVVINAEMTVTADGRLYGLLSLSEKWRVDAQLTEAISYLSGLRIMVLDGMDILDLPSRSQCLVWLDILGSECDTDGIVVCATLKEPPKKLPPTFQMFWMQDGEVVDQAAIEKAA